MIRRELRRMGADWEAIRFSLNDVGVWVVLRALLRVRGPGAMVGRGSSERDGGLWDGRMGKEGEG